jgi:hypothetical protein
MDFICTQALNDWRTLNSLISGLTEDQIGEMLEYEAVNAKRPSVIVRLHQRHTALRATRERATLMKRIQF